MSLFDVAMIRHQLDMDKANMVIVPDLEAYMLLTQVHEIPKERVGVLASVIAALEQPTTYLILSKRQYNHYKREEDKIIEKAVKTDGNDHDK